jgi:hypothetical protein
MFLCYAWLNNHDGCRDTLVSESGIYMYCSVSMYLMHICQCQMKMFNLGFFIIVVDSVNGRGMIFGWNLEQRKVTVGLCVW